MKPTTVMVAGSFLLMPIVLFTPEKYMLLASGTFIFIELVIVVTIFVKRSKAKK